MKSKAKTVMIVISVIWLVFSLTISILLFRKYTAIYIFGLLFEFSTFTFFAGIIFLILLFIGCQSTYYSQSRYIIMFIAALWIVTNCFFCIGSLKNTFLEHRNTKRYTITLSDGNEILFYEKIGENKYMTSDIYICRKDLFLVRGLGGLGNSSMYTNNGNKLPEYTYNEETKEITFYGTYKYSDELHEQFPNLEDREDTFTFEVER